jgi:cytochrome c-type biogenesis protein CcmE
MSRKLLIASLAAVGAVWAVVFGLGKPAAVFSLNVSEFMKRGMADRTVRVRGRIVHGTLCKVSAPCSYRFTLEEAGQQLAVVSEGCVVPETFGEIPGLDVTVTVEGERCHSCQAFKAAQILVTGSGKYEYVNVFVPAPVPLCKPVPRM